jgi:hypothetical protein
MMNSCDWRFAFTRIQVEYIEMPDLKLTPEQIRRLCDLPRDICEVAIVALEQAGFLWRVPDGRLVRRAPGRAGREIRQPGDVFVPAVAGSVPLNDQFAD